MPTEKTSEPIFIIACPRSGTTILATILNRHPNIATAPETHFFNLISKLDYTWNKLTDNDIHSLLNQSRIIDLIKVAELDKELLAQELLVMPKRNQKAFFDLLIKHFLVKKDKARLCEKTPQHLRNVDEILALYPKAKFLHLIRDGRSVVNSLLKMPWRPAGLVNNARFWLQNIRLGEKFTRKYEGTSLLTIRFEDIMIKPEETIMQVCNFIGEEYSDSLLDTNLKDNIFPSWENNWKHKSTQQLDSKRVNAWSDEMTTEDKTILEWMLSSTLIKYGYTNKRAKLNFKSAVKLSGEYIELAIRKLYRGATNLIN